MHLILADGPAQYFGGTIETFALPMGTFIVIAGLLYYIYRRPHSVARLKYQSPATQTSVATREPGKPGLTHFARASAQAAQEPRTETEGKTEESE